MTDESVTPPASRPFAVKAFGVTDKGKVRATNEDQFLIAELTKAMRVWQTSLAEPKLQVGDERGHLFLVADGMGGHRAGERASGLAVAAIEHFTLNSFRWFFDSGSFDAERVLAQFQAAIRQVDARIFEEVVEHPEEGLLLPVDANRRHGIFDLAPLPPADREVLARDVAQHAPPSPELGSVVEE